MGDTEADLRALLDYVAKSGRVTKTDVVARFRWSPSRAVENLREGVRRGLIARMEPESEEERVSYVVGGAAR
ncbi:MAG: hypothetical protein QXO51_07810 [Halobacteria archaeon]